MENFENNTDNKNISKTENDFEMRLGEDFISIRDERLARIDEKLNFLNSQNSFYHSASEVEQSKEQEFQAKKFDLEKGLGIKLGKEASKNIQQNLVDSYVNQTKKYEKMNEDLERLKKAANLLTPKDFVYFEKILGNKDGDINQLFKLKGNVFHTTNDFNFGRILESGGIQTSIKNEGMYKSTGASFGDGNFDEAATFQTLFEDQNSHSLDKKFNSDKYSNKVKDLITFFWKKNKHETAEYLSKISKDEKVETLDDAIKVAESFKFKAKPKGIENNTEALSKLYGVTIVYAKDKIPDLSKKDTEGIQKDFELRSFKEGGVPLSDASTIFVPESQVENVKKILKENKLSQIEVRKSEELEVIRTVKLLNRKL